MKKVLQREIKKINKNDQKILNKNRFNNFCVKYNKNKNFDNSFKDEQNFLKKKNKTIFIEFNSNNSTINSTNNISFNNIISIKNNNNNNNSFYKTNFKKIINKKNNLSLSEKATRNNIKKNTLKNNKNNFNKTTNFINNNNNNKTNQKLNFNINKKIKSKTPINLRNSSILNNNLKAKKNCSQKNLNKMFFSTLPRALIDISKNDKIAENINIKYNNDEIINFNLKLKNKNNIFNSEIINELKNLNFILNKIINTYNNYKNEEN